MSLLLAAAEVPVSMSACQEIQPQEIAADSKTYSLAEGVRLVFGRDASLDTASDYGERAMLYASERGEINRTYFSSGSKDSYAMRPTFIGRCGPHELLILADIGAEYSWGFRVFAYNGRHLRDLGEIPIAVRGDLDAESAIQFVKLTPRDGAIELTFTADVIKDPGGQSPQSLAANKVRYRIGSVSITTQRGY